MCCIYQWFITSVLHFPGSRAELLWFTRGASPPELAQNPGSGCERSGAEPGPGQRDTSHPRSPADRTGPRRPLRVIYCARPRSPPPPAPSVCPQACPALASSLRGARLFYLLQHRVIYKIFNKTRIFLTVTAAFLFTWDSPFTPPAFSRPGRGLGGREGTDPGGGAEGLRAPGRPGRRRFANATKRAGWKSFSFDFNKTQLGEGEVKLFPRGADAARHRRGGCAAKARSPNPAGSRLPLRRGPRQRRRLQVRVRPAPRRALSLSPKKFPVEEGSARVCASGRRCRGMYRPGRVGAAPGPAGGFGPMRSLGRCAEHSGAGGGLGQRAPPCSCTLP